MMQLVCNGIALDLYANTGVQFTHDNPLFAFDDLKCERTTEFKLPCTATNDAVLSLARIPAYKGEGMRRKFNAVLIDGLVQKTGYLYVSSFDGKDYKAIFVTGELIGLQAIKNAGKLAEIKQFTDVVRYTGTGKDIGGIAPIGNWDSVNYVSQSEYGIIPSFNLAYVTSELLNELGVTGTIPVSVNDIRVISPKPYGIKEKPARLVSTYLGLANRMNNLDTEELLQVEFVQYADSSNQVWQRDYYDANTGTLLKQENNRSGNYTQYVRQFKTNANLQITFPDTFPDDVYIVSLQNVELATGDFLGGYSFAKTPNFDRNTGFDIARTGEPLRGRTVSIPNNTTFILVSEDDYYFQNDWEIMTIGTFTGEVRILTHGYDFRESARLSLNFDFSVKVAGDEETAQIGEYVRLQDNLPDVTLVDLLKTIAAMSGKVLNYSDADGISFDNLDFDNWSTIEIKDIIKFGELKREFCKYAQNNIIRYDSEDYILNSQRIFVNYTVDNDNLEAENELLEIPLSEGMRGSADNVEAVEVRDGEKYTAATTDTVGTNMTRVYLSRNNNLQVLCDASTQIGVQCKMTLYEYEKLIAKTILLVHNTKYVWTNKKWRNGTADLTIAKLL